MNNEDLKQPRINILYISERKQDAENLCSKYSGLGARVMLIEVGDDNTTRQHLGKLCYFDTTPRAKEIAISLAKSLQSVESVSLQYVGNQQRQQCNYAVWIVSKVVSQKFEINRSLIKPSQKANVELKTVCLKPQAQTLPTDKILVQCPECRSSIRHDRLDTHLKKVHSQKRDAAAAFAALYLARKAIRDTHLKKVPSQKQSNYTPLFVSRAKITKHLEERHSPKQVVTKRPTHQLSQLRATPKKPKLHDNIQEIVTKKPRKLLSNTTPIKIVRVSTETLASLTASTLPKTE